MLHGSPGGAGSAPLRGAVRLHGLDGTAAFAAQVAGWLRPGDVVLLVGDLGAGKTAFVRALAAALGSTDEVVSPTFTIMRHVSFTWPDATPGTLLHLDAYRLGGPDDLEDLGVLELVDDGAVAVIEWGDVVGAAVAGMPRVLRIGLAVPADGAEAGAVEAGTGSGDRDATWAWDATPGEG